VVGANALGLLISWPRTRRSTTIRVPVNYWRKMVGANGYREVGLIRKTQDLGKLAFVARCDDYFRFDSRDQIDWASGMDVVRADERDELVAKRGAESR
jgi:hypothetical protein